VREAEGFCPGRIWSLWDIMHKVNSGSLLRIMQEFSVLGQLLMDALAMPNALAWDRTLNFQVKNLENIKEKAKS
jgi:hypothetical protein